VSIDIDTLTDRVVSHAMTLGVFDRVNGHEPKVAPNAGSSLTAAVWLDRVEPVKSSGLNSTSVRMAFNVRLYTSMLSEPQDAIDPALVRALDALMGAYSGDFSLGGAVRMVDLLGAYGAPLAAQAGYIQQDQRLYRVFTVTLPLIINDVWEQVS
jgi:hypothetical protein